MVGMVTARAANQEATGMAEKKAKMVSHGGGKRWRRPVGTHYQAKILPKLNAQIFQLALSYHPLIPLY